MKRYINIYKSLLKINLDTLMAYRLNFINNMFSSAAWGIFSVVSILILTSRTQSIFGWRREDIILLTACYSLAIGIFHAVFSWNFHRMGRVIFLGELDQILLKPLDSQFSLSLWLFNYSSLVRILLGIGLILYLIYTVGYSISLIGIVAFFLYLLVGIITLYGIWFLVCSLLIWIPEASNIVELMYSVSGLSRYPPEMYSRLSGYLFSILLPLLFILVVPVKILIGKPNPVEIFSVTIVCIVSIVISRLFWTFALRHYSS